MMKTAAVMVLGALVVTGCGRNSYPSSPSQLTQNGATSSASAAGATSPASATPHVAEGQRRVAFGFNGTVSGFPKGKVFVSGGGAFERSSHFVNSGGGFTCIDPVLQGPLSMSINPNDPGACLAGQGIRWDTAALLDSTMFKCTASATAEPAVTSDTTAVLQADFYREGDGNDESFRATMIVSKGDISTAFPGVNIWVQGVGCGTAQAVNFNN